MTAKPDMSADWPDLVQGYDELLQSWPDLFRNPKDALMRVVTDKRERQAIEQQLRERQRAKGQPEHWALAGKFYEDAWLMMVRDVVIFAGSEVGTYHRVVLKDGNDSVVVVPCLGDRFVLIRHSRHAIRSWSLELPRGHVGQGRPVEDAAKIELSEELGADVLSFRRLGMVQSDTSLTFNPIHVVRAELKSLGTANRVEGVESFRLLTRGDLLPMLASGEINDVVSVAALSYALFLDAAPAGAAA